MPSYNSFSVLEDGLELYLVDYENADFVPVARMCPDVSIAYSSPYTFLGYSFFILYSLRSYMSFIVTG